MSCSIVPQTLHTVQKPYRHNFLEANTLPFGHDHSPFSDNSQPSCSHIAVHVLLSQTLECNAKVPQDFLISATLGWLTNNPIVVFLFPNFALFNFRLHTLHFEFLDSCFWGSCENSIAQIYYYPSSYYFVLRCNAILGFCKTKRETVKYPLLIEASAHIELRKYSKLG